MNFDVVKKLNKMRLERNLSVYKLAYLSGLNQSTLANTFSRGLVPSIVNLEAICDAMGVSLAQFFTESEEDFKLTEKERQMLINYRRLPEETRDLIGKLIEKYVDLI